MAAITAIIMLGNAGRKDQMAKERAAELIRILTIPPLMVAVLLLILYHNKASGFCSIPIPVSAFSA